MLARPIRHPRCSLAQKPQLSQLPSNGKFRKVVEGSPAKQAAGAYMTFFLKGSFLFLESHSHGRERRWRRPEAPRKASGSIRNRGEAVKEKGAMNMPAKENAGKQGWVLEMLEMLGKLLKGVE